MIYLVQFVKENADQISHAKAQR